MIPKTMQALQLEEYGQPPKLIEKPVPNPGKGQVLVKMAASPINPSDQSALRGTYGSTSRELPFVAGNEGSGIVVAHNAGLMGAFFMGKRVACLSPTGGDGTWAEYMVTDTALPLHKHISMEQGAMSFVNPLTAWAFIEIMKSEGHKSFVHTAAASQLGRMLLRLAGEQGLTGVYVVRREEQVNLLKEMGAKYVFNSSEPDFEAQLMEACHLLETRIAWDAVGGEMPRILLEAMPRYSKLVIYGSLAQVEYPRVALWDMIFTQQTITSFWLPVWMGKRGFLRSALLASKVQKLVANQLSSEIHARFPLSEADAALRTYESNMTAGKVLFTMGNSPETAE